jgi:opacity protein-like surface antigen
MSRVFLITAILLFASASGLAQVEHPKTEISGTYQAFVADIDFLDNETLQGWGFGVQWNPSRWLGVVTEFNGAYGSSKVTGPVINPLATAALTDIDTSVHTYLFGPRVSWRANRVTAFAHTLFGGGTLSVDCSTCNSVSNTKFAMSIGGGLDVNINPRIAIRVMQFDYVPIKTSLGLNFGDSSYFRNSRYQAGVVFKY